MHPFKHLRGKHDQRDHGRRQKSGVMRGAQSKGGGVAVDTQTPFDPLPELLGWKRQRPAVVANMDAFRALDQNTPGSPKWMNDVDWDSSPLAEVAPLTFRDVNQTPEGDPVLIMMGGENTGVSRLSQMDPELVVDTAYVPSVIDAAWIRDIWNQGNAVFTEQSPDRDDFWNQTPVDAENRPGYYGTQRTLAQAVEHYGDWGSLETNDFLRQGPYDGIRALRNNMQTVQDIDSSEQYIRRKSTLDRYIAHRDVRRAVEEHDEARNLIATLDAGMRPAPRNIFVRRGVGSVVSASMQQHLQVGDRFTDDSFTSTSITPTFNWTLSAPMMNIIVTEGTPVFWVGGRARKKEKENELVIGRGTTYEVVSTDNERGWILRTVPPKGKYRPPKIPDQVPLAARRFLQTVPQKDPFVFS
jgi:hypothetical protein